MLTRWWKHAQTTRDRVELFILSCVVGAMIVGFFWVLGAALVSGRPPH